MKRHRKLIEAVSAWLNFEAMCRRQELFSESYIAYPIGQFLGARHGYSLKTEYLHPILAPLKMGRGDRPRIDFAVLGNDGKVELAVETKWLSSSKTLIRDIVRDLVRLELLNHHHHTEAYFLLAGESRKMIDLFGQSRFQGYPGHSQSKPILPYETHQYGSLRFNPPPAYRHEFFGKTLEVFQGVELSNAMNFIRYGPVPTVATSRQYVACSWRVVTRSVERFLPENIFGYD